MTAETTKRPRRAPPPTPSPRPDLRVVRYEDWFRVTNAPYEWERRFSRDGRGSYEVKRYLDVAYTAAHMARSEESGRLVRWVVRLSDGSAVSHEGLFRIRSREAWERTIRPAVSRLRGERRERAMADAFWGMLSPEEREAMVASVDLDAYTQGRGVEEAREALFEDLRVGGSPLALVDAGWDRRIRDRYAERHLGGPHRSAAWASAPWARWVAYVYACRGLPAPDDIDPGRMPAFDAKGRPLPWWESVLYSYFSRPSEGREAEVETIARTLWRRLGGVPVEAEMLPFPPDGQQEQRRLVLALRDARFARMDRALVVPGAPPVGPLHRLTQPDELRRLWFTIPR